MPRTEYDDGGPAFPVTAPNGDIYSGASVRQYFAAAALTGILANPNFDGSLLKAARASFAYADALIEEGRNP